MYKSNTSNGRITMNNTTELVNKNSLKMYAATAMAQTLSFSMERKYLERIGDDSFNPFFKLHEIETSSKLDVSWIEISQVGKPIKDDAGDCFTAIQKILYSCFMPQEMQLLFLIVKDNGINKMYLGVRPMNTKIKRNVTRYLNDFIKGAWPGLQSHVVKEPEKEDVLQRFSSNVNEEKWEYVYAMTGIPSMESQYKTTYPATIDKLMVGMNQSKSYAYLVVADPIDSNEVDGMLYQCREMNGQAESLKSFNISEGRTEGISHSITDGTTSSTTDGSSESKSKKDWGGIANKLLGIGGLGFIGAGVAVAAGISFPPAMAALPALIGSQSLSGIGGTLLGFMGQKTTSTSHSKTEGTSHSVTEGMSESQSETISHNVVNKHIESISEHLFYHSKRLETGKATGMWKVGAYLLAGKETDVKGGSMQLRSILSGQESIYEPIRITDISNVINSSKTFGQLQSPIIRVENAYDSQPFDHPLGDNYKELKTVLTTKELSYYINFPLRSVPGISVIESSPEFSLNPEGIATDNSMSFGKLLYGGSETKIEYNIPIEVLSRHTLISGINGSGKTNTIQAILNHLSTIPYLVIEPAKTEYVDWAIDYNNNHPNDPIDIYIPGCKKYKGSFKPKELKLNPFELVWLDPKQEINVLTHIDRLKSTFASAFPMYDILPVLMEDLIYTVYQNKSTDWLNVQPQYGKTMPPTLNSMSMSVDQVIEHRQYEDKVQRNMKACLNTRIDSLKRGWKGELLNTLKSTPWEDLFGKKCVINLSYVGDNIDKSFMMALLLQFLYEYRSACAEVGITDYNDNRCKHLTIIEEAHRVMSKCENQELPQYKSAMMFSNMLSEIRAYGEGLMLVDQVPTRLIPDAIKNTNLKITHRLVAEDDCKAIGESMGLNEEQRKVIPKLMTGQCIISSSLATDIYWVKADKVK